jgi:hypothetical protein
LVRGGAPFGKGDGGIRKTPFLMGKSDANECNENSFSNCRVQLALSTKRDGVILEKRYCNEEPNITFFKILIGVTTCNIVVTLYW